MSRHWFLCEGRVCHYTSGNGLWVSACYHTGRSVFVHVLAYFICLFLSWETPDLVILFSSSENVLELSKAVYFSRRHEGRNKTAMKQTLHRVAGIRYPLTVEKAQVDGNLVAVNSLRAVDPGSFVGS